jgi:hypothetical protein
VRAPCRIDGDEAAIPKEAREAIGAVAGDRVHVIPFD